MNRLRQAGNLVFIWAAFTAYPKVAPVVNRGVQLGLGNETEWQIPETADEAALHTAFGVGKIVAESPWTFQLLWLQTVMPILMTCDLLINLLRLAVDIFKLILTVTPYIVSAVQWVVRKVSDFVEVRRRPVVPVVRFAPRAVLSPRGGRGRRNVHG
jgi:hypothetical protein